MKKLISLLFFINFVIFSATAIPKGTKLCDEIFKDFKKNGLAPRVHNLITSGTNDFPYNILITNKTSQNSLLADNLIFVIPTENAYENKEVIIDFANFLKENEFPFNTSILLSYGEDSQELQKYNVSGTSEYIKTINTDTYNVAIVLNLCSQENGFETGAFGKSVPAWLIKYTYNTFKKAGIKDNLPHFYISQLSKFREHQDSILSNFLINDIPAISIRLNANYEEKEAFLESFAQNYAESCVHDWDSHTIMFSIFGKSFWMNELSIVFSLIFVIFISLSFLFILSLINSSLRSQAWAELKKIWYTVPLIFLISLGINFLIKVIFYNLAKTGVNFAPYTMVYIQIIVTCPLVILFCLIEMKYHNQYKVRTIDFMTLLITFLNQFLFCLIDISLFPLFMTICIISILSIIFKKNRFHIVLLIIMALPLLPYTYRLLHTTQTNMLTQTIISSNFLPIIEAFFTLPFYFMGYRILKASRINKYLTSGLIYSVLISLIILAASTLFNTKKTVAKNEIRNYVNDNLISLTYSDKNFFGETIRTLKIDLGEEAEYCFLEVSGLESQAVLYSENSYEIENSKTSYFKIPKNPPQKMTFSYGTIKGGSNISITALYKDENSPIQKVRNFSIRIEDSL
ncbi:MAG: hypothetical protein K5829_11625 [Treponema sp.]|nr:hypothetical protein [Treponema sp.]